MIGPPTARRVSLFTILLPLILAGLPAQAQPVSPASSPNPAGGFTLLDVPFVSQSELLCGGAAAAMVLRYWGEREITAEHFAPLVDRSASGIRTTNLVDELRRRDWMVVIADGTPQLIDEMLTDGRPLLALIEDRPGVYHYVVIVGSTAGSVVFHDPARAPLRVMSRDEFARRSQAAGRWVAVVLPGDREPAAPVAPPIATATAGSSCDERVRQGIAEAQAGDLDASERTLTAALSCPGPSALRELAGVRLLQRRWDDVAQLAEQASAIDPNDAYTWQLLGTSRFVLGQPLAALDAWNHASEPRLDLIKVNGLERTRQRPVERILGIDVGQVIGSGDFVRAERALRDLPAARTSRLELVPVGRGLAELHATLAERPLVPRDVWGLAAIGARAAISRVAGITLGSPSGSGESVTVEWRYWQGRPAISASLRSPAAWPGTWGADVFAERQTFDLGQPEVRRRGGRLAASRWATSSVRLDVRAGAERWNTTPTLATVGVTVNGLSAAERVGVRIGADGWLGDGGFGSLLANVTASTRSTVAGAVPLGTSVTVSAGAGTLTRQAPLDLWLAGDTGQVRQVLARAHPLLDDGRVRVERLGRRLIYGSAEAQYWWTAPAFSRIGAAVFVDAVRTMARLAGSPVTDVDVGAGVGLTSLLAPGRVRVDFAHGLRDGADALSVRYVTPLW